MNPHHYLDVAQAFDKAAGGYDSLYGPNWIMAWMRQQSLATLRASFPAGGRLLELGCGTGEEALALSRQGLKVVATDVSPAMIQVAQAKASDDGNNDVTWRVLPAGEVMKLVQEYGPATFDGVYASFGGLNCEPRLGYLAASLADLLRPGSPLVCSIMNRWCLWEITWNLARLKPGRAFRRLRAGWASAGLASPDGSLSVPVRYYRPTEFARAFAPHFVLESVSALPVFLPPPYLAHLFGPQTGLRKMLETLDRSLRKLSPFSALGDHFLMVLRATDISTRSRC